jgi:hypothetical protein
VRNAKDSEISAVRDQIAGQVAIINGLREERDRERSRADVAERALAGERGRSDALRGDLDHARAAVQDALEVADALRAGADTGGGRWAAGGVPGGLGEGRAGKWREWGT